MKTISKRVMLPEKAYRIKKNVDFQGMYKKGHSIANRQFVVYTRNNKEIDHFRLGINVSKKLDNAVLRNKVKRAIRENFKVRKSHVLVGDIIIIARRPTKDMTTLQVQNSLKRMLEIAEVLNRKIR